jgi:pilus assembly protein CpaF
MIKVRIKEKGGGEQVLTFERDTINIGRARGNDIVLPRPNISKRHARIMLNEGEIYAVDLKSTNGTYVNGDRISAPVKISDSDKVFMGDFLLLVEDVMEEEALVPEELPPDAELFEPPPPPDEASPPTQIAPATEGELPLSSDSGQPDEVLEEVWEPEELIPEALPPESPGGASGDGTEEMLAMMAEQGASKAPTDATRTEAAVSPDEPDAPPEGALEEPEEAPAELEEAPAEAGEEAILQELAAEKPVLGEELGEDVFLPQDVDGGDEPEFEEEGEAALADQRPQISEEIVDDFEEMPETGAELGGFLDDEAAESSGTMAMEQGQSTGGILTPPHMRPMVEEMDREMEDMEREAVATRITFGDTPKRLLDALRGRTLESQVNDTIAQLAPDFDDFYALTLPEDSVDKVSATIRKRVGEELDNATLNSLIRDLTGLGAVDVFLRHARWDTFHAQGHEQVTVSAEQESVLVPHPFGCRTSYRLVLERVIRHMTGQGSDGRPSYHGTVTGAEDVHVYLPPFTGGEPILHITRRHHSFDPMVHWIEQGVLDEVMAEHLGQSVSQGANVLVVGEDVALRERFLESLALFVAPDRRMLTAQDRPRVITPQSKLLTVSRAHAEVAFTEVAAEIRRFGPSVIVLPELGLNEALTWVPFLFEPSWSTLASTHEASFQGFQDHLTLLCRTITSLNPETFPSVLQRVFTHVVELKTYDCGARKVKRIGEWVPAKEGASSLIRMNRYVFKEERVSPEGKIVGHFEKSR